VLDSTEGARSFQSPWLPKRKRKTEPLIQQTTQAPKSNLTSDLSGLDRAKIRLGSDLDELRHK